MIDPYKILGISANASPDDIKKAFKSKAKEYHPDKPTGNETKFKQINEAYEILKDPQKRQMHDHGGMNPNFSRGRDGSFRFSFGDGAGFDDMVNEFFGGGFGQRQSRRGQDPFSSMRGRPMRNRDIKITLNCTLEDIFFQTSKELNVSLPSGETKNVNVTLPVDSDDGTTIRFRGLGDNTQKQFDPGDLLVRLLIQPHNRFQRQGYDLTHEYKINVLEVLVGKTIELEHISLNTVRHTLPAGSQPDQTIRFKGKGMPKPNGEYGDLYIKLKPYTPKELNTNVLKELKKLI